MNPKAAVDAVVRGSRRAQGTRRAGTGWELEGSWPDLAVRAPDRMEPYKEQGWKATWARDGTTEW